MSDAFYCTGELPRSRKRYWFHSESDCLFTTEHELTEEEERSYFDQGCDEIERERYIQLENEQAGLY